MYRNCKIGLAKLTYCQLPRGTRSSAWLLPPSLDGEILRQPRSARLVTNPQGGPGTTMVVVINACGDGVVCASASHWHELDVGKGIHAD
ncbi:hypothetical protein NDU88_011306 [Pleurodeles waltl]|uniref:Uncharacterized protein n=1 Tax=Pleurodeles waltl TaxID=8319 RepID=A0AAV7QYT6_PLEWA|nr:hypothetical protein NDU88_011306 [Pleurodeles waltl]